MRASPALIFYLMRREQFCASPCQSGDGLTRIGFGHVIRTHEHARFSGAAISNLEAAGLLEQDCDPIELYFDAINGRFAYPLEQQQFDGLVALAYRAGLKAIETSAVLRHLRAGDVGAAADEFYAFDWIDDHRNGCVMRRASRHMANRCRMDRAIFTDGVYA